MSFYKNEDKQYALITDYYNGLEIIDIADPIHPKKLGTLDTDGYAYMVRSFEKDGN